MVIGVRAEPGTSPQAETAGTGPGGEVGEGQAVKSCQWNKLDANTSAIDFCMYNSVNILL